MQKRLNQYYTEQLHLSRISANNNFKGNVSEIIANFDRKNESNFGCKSNKSFKFIEGSLVILKNNSDNKIYTVVGYEYETDKDVCNMSVGLSAVFNKYKNITFGTSEYTNLTTENGLYLVTEDGRYIIL